jgi:hypothetical protein
MQVQVEITQRGLSLTALGETMPKLRDRLVELMADSAYSTMQEEAPRGKSDKLWRSIHKVVAGEVATVKPEAPYALYVEKGTRSHMIYPVRARALRFSVDSKIVFSAYAKHPGTKPNPFIARTAAFVQRRIPQLFDKAWQEALTEASA